MERRGERKRNKPSFHMTHTTTYNSDVVSSMEDHRGEGNDGGIRMISSDELCKHVAASDRLKHPIDKLRTTKDFATNPAEDSGWREGSQDGVDDEAGEEEEEPKLEHDKHEGHCMAGSAATSNIGDLRGQKAEDFGRLLTPSAPLQLLQWGRWLSRWWMAMNLPATRGDEEMDIDA
uniref:Uncharacterized protein n=1 Tax=Oryza meridionalis TaxID=40149 RepID=A0A0E0DB77_9ORYZ